MVAQDHGTTAKGKHATRRRPAGVAHHEPPGSAKGPRGKLDARVAPAPHRRHRAARTQSFVLGAVVLFVGLAVLAHYVPYFPVDLVVTKAIQADHGVFFDRLMAGLSWLGFFPQVTVLVVLVILLLYFIGLRWEAVATAFAAAGFSVGTLVKLIVVRPRPTADLVHVARQISATSFPSGHVLLFTTFCGFLAFLTFTLLKPHWARTLLTVVLAMIVLLMGVSRIDQGHHWFSDVLGAYVLGGLWLALTIKFYRWGKPRYFVDQPVAPEDPAARRVAESK